MEELVEQSRSQGLEVIQRLSTLNSEFVQINIVKLIVGAENNVGHVVGIGAVPAGAVTD